jgi:hypothetical protein
LAKANADLDRETAKAIDTYAKTVRDFDKQEKRLAESYDRSWEERNRAFLEARGDANEAFAKQVTDAQKQISNAVQNAVSEQRAQLLQASQQLAAFRVAETDSARTSSEALGDLAERESKATTREEQQAIIKERLKMQNAQGAAAVALQKQISQGQGNLHTEAEKTQLAIEKSAQEMVDQIKEMTKEFEKQQKRATEARDRADAEALRAYEEQTADMAEARKEAAGAHREQMGELDRRRREAQQQANEARAKAEEAMRKARQNHLEAVAKAEEAKQEAIRQADEARDESIQQAADALEAAREKHEEAMEKARQDLALAQDNVRSLLAVKDELQTQTPILEEIARQRHPIQVDMNNMNIEEGDVEFLERAAERAEELANAPIGS